jgi:RimJ/RimL family protein N-acetyltransferase
MNFWQGKNIRLRAIEPGDAATFSKWNLDSDRGRFLDFLWPPTSQAADQKWTEQASLGKLENDAFHWLIENLDGEPVGSIATHDCSPRNGTFSYGIDIAAEHQRKGYASEAIRMVLRYYFDELRYQKVTIMAHSDNEASIRLHENLGFQREGTLRRMAYTHGGTVDAVWFGMTIEEYHALYRDTA